MKPFNSWVRQQKKEDPILLAKKRHDKAIKGLVATPELDKKIAKLREDFEIEKNKLKEDFNIKIKALIVENVDKEIELINQEKNG